jgi:hypothetical protein
MANASLSLGSGPTPKPGESAFSVTRSTPASVSRHAFEWLVTNVTNGQVDSKAFVMRVRGLDVICYVGFFKASRRRIDPGVGSDSELDYSDDGCNGCSLQTFFYELTWGDGENKKPLLYACEVRAFNNGKVVWSDKKATADGRHVSSSVVPPKVIVRNG